MTYLEPAALRRCLDLRDLSDPTAGPHAMQHVVDALERALARAWAIPVRRHRGDRIVPVADHYDRLRYPADAVTRDARYTRYVDGGRMLRAHTTAAIPDLLGHARTGEVLLSVPGIPTGATSSTGTTWASRTRSTSGPSGRPDRP